MAEGRQHDGAQPVVATGQDAAPVGGELVPGELQRAHYIPR